MQLSKVETDRLWRERNRKDRNRILMWSGAALIIFLLCLSVRYNAYYYPEEWFVPGKYLESFWLGVKLLVSMPFNTELWANRDQYISDVGDIYFYGALARLRLTVTAFAAGGGIALAGAIFQTAYRNPMASPNMIGATAGVGLGNAVVVALYSAQAFTHILLRYEYCYGFTVICVGLVLLLGKLASIGQEEYSVMEMVMAGSIIGQCINVFTMYIMYNMEDEDMQIYQEINLGTYEPATDVELITLIFFGIMAIAVIPVLLMRYRLNVLSMDRSESRALGINAGPYRMLAQICGVVMVTSATIHCGQLGMVSMVVPYLIRRFVGADFRNQCIFSFLLGGIIMILGKTGTSFIMIAGTALPVTFITNIILMPAFFFIVAAQKGGARADEA